jgi:hypothetical protein
METLSNNFLKKLILYIMLNTVSLYKIFIWLRAAFSSSFNTLKWVINTVYIYFYLPRNYSTTFRHVYFG